jgi:hypothetical protein
MDQSAENPYMGKYQGQKVTVGSRVFQDKDRNHVGLEEREAADAKINK